MKTNLTILLFFISTSIFMSCEEESTETETKYQMCYDVSEVSSGTQIIVNCRPSDEGCDSGYNTLAQYSNFSDCRDDQDYVVDKFIESGGDIVPGPLSISGSNGDSSNAASCSLDNYNDVGIDPQYEAQCQAAYVYWCAGQTSALQAQCETYKSLASQLNLPPCSYCD